MNLLQAAIFGVIQGLTEFLPISSSGHLVLLPWFFGWDDPGLAFDVALHWGTLLGVVIYFRTDLAKILKDGVGPLKGEKSPDHLLLWKIALGTVPAALAGFLLDDWAETVFRSPWVIAAMLVGVGLLLLLADKKKGKTSSLDALSWSQALLIGATQGLALIPGVSRSGITITTALFLGYNRLSAVRFSFLLSIPIILGAGILKVDYLLQNLTHPFVLTGILTAALSGYAAVFFLMTYVKNRTFTPFVIYRMALAGVIVIWLLK